MYIINIVDIEEWKVNQSKRLVNDSELLRIIEAIDCDNVLIENGHKYLTGIISVNVGFNCPKYKILRKNGSLLVLEHYYFVKDEEGNFKTAPLCKEDTNERITEHFIRAVVGSGHSRGSKALFVRKDLFEKLNEILLGGINKFIEDNNFPYYEKGYAKWNSYYALASTDSKVVNYVPKIVVVDDFERSVSDIFDMVYQDKSLNVEWKKGDDEKNKFKKRYRVEQNVEKEKSILPFDGAGLVSVECAEKWAEELNCINSKGKKYIPASFQFRIIPGFKGNLYTFDIKSFGSKNGNVITDIKGKQHDISKEMVDIILTKSQAKFIGWFDNDVSKWRSKFDDEVVFYKKDSDGIDTQEIDCSYKRTFNISEYAEDACDLKRNMLTAYQHLQTIEFTEDEIKSICQNTVDKIENISTNIEEFLRFRSCTDDEEKEEGWKYIPPYYKAAYYCSPENRKILFNDNFFKSKVAEDIKGIRNRAMSGKLYIEGNYQVLTPDLFGLAQFSFGQEVIGLLRPEEIYSNWWNKLKYKDTDGNMVSCDYNELALIRNPHIYMEARIVRLLRDSKEKTEHERYLEILKWFKYQTTGILTDSYSTIPLALGTADFDGDHIAGTSSKEYIAAVKRARDNKDGNTVDYEIVLKDDLNETNEKSNINSEMADVSNIEKLMDFDILAFQNNIGQVIDKVTLLWGIEQNEDNKEKLRKYIEIADVIGQLTIDAAKTGEFEEFYSEITDFINEKNVLKPYFMRYLAKNEKKKNNEENAINNVELFFGHLSADENKKKIYEEIRNKQIKFSFSDTNVNRICKYLDSEFQRIEIKIDASTFRLDKFMKIFVTDTVSETSELYIRIKKILLELMKEFSDISLIHKDDNSDDKKKDRGNHYRYFYSYARSQLLNQCRLSEEKSLNKVLNIVIVICYREKECMDNTSAKNILWNVFEKELIGRAKGNVLDKEIDFSIVAKRAVKTKELKKASYEKKLSGKDVYISELADRKKTYNCIKISNKEIVNIRDKITSQMKLYGKEIGKKKTVDLRRLYGVLLVISKRMEFDREVKKKDVDEKEIRHVIPTLQMSKGNNTINASNLAKLSGFGDSQRKRIIEMLKDLNELGLIYIYHTNMNKIKFKVQYQNSDEDIVIETEDFVAACKLIRQKFR